MGLEGPLGSGVGTHEQRTQNQRYALVLSSLKKRTLGVLTVSKSGGARRLWLGSHANRASDQGGVRWIASEGRLRLIGLKTTVDLPSHGRRAVAQASIP
jgi:hypothetical protein